MKKDDYMNKEEFPNPEITKLILDHFDGFLGLKKKSIDFGLEPTLNFKYCKIEFQVQMTTLRLSLVERTKSNVYGLGFLVIRDKYQWISFDDYLKYINSSELLKIENDPALDNYASIEAQLLLFKKYLSSDLKKIFTNNEWIEVPFYRD